MYSVYIYKKVHISKINIEKIIYHIAVMVDFRNTLSLSYIGILYIRYSVLTIYYY